MQDSRGGGGGGPEGLKESFWILTPQSLSWVSESFRQDIGQILLGNYCLLNICLFMKNLTDFRKTVEPVWICACQWFWSKVRGHGIAVLSLEDF